MRLLPGAEHLRDEFVELGLTVEAGFIPAGERVVEETADGFVVEYPGRLRIGVAGLVQESARHLRASVRACRRADSPGAGRLHLDTLDLYHARSRRAFAKTAACVLGEDPIVLEDRCARLVALAESFLARRREPEAPVVVVTDAERRDAAGLLEDPRLLDWVVVDLERLGYMGEAAGKKLAWLAAVSRKLEDPLSVLVVARSGAGKSTLAETAAMLAPEEDVLRFTRLTAQTLYYQKPKALAHKLVLVEEDSGLKDASYALRALQSARRLSLSAASGRGESVNREVRGPVSLIVTTTRPDVDEETASRFVVVTTDESVEQTERILAAQRESEARPSGDREAIVRVHRNAQRLVDSLPVVNPFAPKLRFPHRRLSARRDQRKYLALIRAVALAHQRRRERKGGAIVVAAEDVRIANELAAEVMGQSLWDLSPPSRRLLADLRAWLVERATGDGSAVEDLRFGQRELRERFGWRRSQLAAHIRELVEAEYLVAHVGPPGRRTRYALDWSGEGLDGGRFVKGLLDPQAMEDSSGPLPAQVRPTAGSRRSTRKGASGVTGGRIDADVRSGKEE